MFSDFFPVFWVRVSGLGAWTGAGAAGQGRANATRGNLDSRVDSGAAEVFLAEPPTAETVRYVSSFGGSQTSPRKPLELMPVSS